MTIRGMEEVAMRRLGAVVALLLNRGPDRPALSDIRREMADLAADHPLPAGMDETRDDAWHPRGHHVG
jgi:hypothetical protein